VLDLTHDRRGRNLLAFVVMRRYCDRGYAVTGRAM
jgi:hypothetical protein